MYDLPRARQAGLAALIVVLAAGCTTSQATNVGASPVVDHQSFVGGCAGTTLTDADPPAWAQAGWTVVKGAPWPVPWATGTHGDFVAFLFATELVAGPSPRVDGSDNKVLWVNQGLPTPWQRDNRRASLRPISAGRDHRGWAQRRRSAAGRMLDLPPFVDRERPADQQHQPRGSSCRDTALAPAS